MRTVLLAICMTDHLEPITQGVEKQVQQDMLDLVTRERLRELLEAPVSSMSLESKRDGADQ